MNWQVITVDQAKELELLNLTEPATLTWLKSGENEFDLVQQEGFVDFIQHNAYNLAEIAVMLGYTFVKTNVKEAAEQLIQELKVGSSTAKDCNQRLKEAKQQSF